MATGVTRATSGILGSTGVGTGVLANVSDIDDVMPKMIAPAKFFYEQGQVMRPLVTKYPFAQGQGQTFYLPKFGKLTAYHLEEGVRINQAQKLATTTPLTILPGECGVQVLVTKRALKMAKEDLFRAIGKLTGNAMAILEDKDLLTLLGGISGSVGANGTQLVTGHLMAARAKIAGNATEPAPPPYVGVLHDWQYHAVAEDLAVLSGGANTFPVDGGLGGDVLRDYFIGNIAGIQLFRDNNITITSNNATGCVFSKEAFAYVEFAPIETDKSYDADYRGWKVNVTADYGFGEYQDVFGCRLISDASTPTN